MKTFLKYEKFGNEVTFFDREKLSKVRVYNNLEVEISYLDDEYDFQDTISREIKNGSSIISEKEFNDSMKKFKNELNLILD